MATVKYDVFITYDIEKKDTNLHDEVKKSMIKKGYADRLTYTFPAGTDKAGTTKILYLPNTSLWKEKINVKEAYEDIQECLQEFIKTLPEGKSKPILERCIALEFTDVWTGLFGAEHAGDSKAPNKNIISK